jgi:hypothetical protein
VSSRHRAGGGKSCHRVGEGDCEKATAADLP